MSGNHSRRFRGHQCQKLRPATSPLINRLIALGLPFAQLDFTRSPLAAIAVRTLSLDADCLSSIAMFLLARSETELDFRGAPSKRATRNIRCRSAARLRSFSAVFCLLLRRRDRLRVDVPPPSAVAAATCLQDCSGVGNWPAANARRGANPWIFAGALPEPASGITCRLQPCLHRTRRKKSGMRKILKPANWGKPGFRIHQGQHPQPAHLQAINRSIALGLPLAELDFSRPRRRDRGSGPCRWMRNACPSIAMSLPARSDIDLISGRSHEKGRPDHRCFGDAGCGWFLGITQASITCSAITVAAVTCCCIFLASGSAAALAAARLAGSSPRLQCTRRERERAESCKARDVGEPLRPPAETTSARTAAGTSPLINRSIAAVLTLAQLDFGLLPPPRSPVRTIALDADCLVSIAMSFVGQIRIPT